MEKVRINMKYEELGQIIGAAFADVMNKPDTGISILLGVVRGVNFEIQIYNPASLDACNDVNAMMPDDPIILEPINFMEGKS